MANRPPFLRPGGWAAADDGGPLESVAPWVATRGCWPSYRCSDAGRTETVARSPAKPYLRPDFLHLIDRVEQRLERFKDRVNDRLDKVDARFTALEEKMDARIDGLRRDLETKING